MQKLHLLYGEVELIITALDAMHCAINKNIDQNENLFFEDDRERLRSNAELFLKLSAKIKSGSITDT